MAKKPFTACSPRVKPVELVSGSSVTTPVVTLKAWETTTASARASRIGAKLFLSRARADDDAGRVDSKMRIRSWHSFALQRLLALQESQGAGGRAAVALDELAPEGQARTRRLQRIDREHAGRRIRQAVFAAHIGPRPGLMPAGARRCGRASRRSTARARGARRPAAHRRAPRPHPRCGGRDRRPRRTGRCFRRSRRAAGKRRGGSRKHAPEKNGAQASPSGSTSLPPGLVEIGREQRARLEEHAPARLDDLRREERRIGIAPRRIEERRDRARARR